MESLFTSKVLLVVGVNDFLTSKWDFFKNCVGGMEVFEYDDKKLSFLWLLFFSQLTLLMMIVIPNIHNCIYLSMYIFKNLGQEGKEAKYLIHFYLGSFIGVMTVVLQNWSWSVEILGELWFFASRWTCSCGFDAKKNPICCSYYCLFSLKCFVLVAICLGENDCWILLMEDDCPK